MEVLVASGIVAALCFTGVLWYGAPYLPTLTPQVRVAFALQDLKAGQTLLELGSGYGKVLLAAAKAGYRAVGIELNPLLVIVAKVRTRHVRDMVQVRWGNYWQQKWPPADAVFVFLLDRYMPKLDARMQTYCRPLVSVAFQVPGRKPTAAQQGVFRYDYTEKLAPRGTRELP